jgi:hypothetical protein
MYLVFLYVDAIFSEAFVSESVDYEIQNSVRSSDSPSVTLNLKLGKFAFATDLLSLLCCSLSAALRVSKMSVCGVRCGGWNWMLQPFNTLQMNVRTLLTERLTD